MMKLVIINILDEYVKPGAEQDGGTSLSRSLEEGLFMSCFKVRAADAHLPP